MKKLIATILITISLAACGSSTRTVVVTATPIPTKTPTPTPSTTRAEYTSRLIVLVKEARDGFNLIIKSTNDYKNGDIATVNNDLDQAIALFQDVQMKMANLIPPPSFSKSQSLVTQAINDYLNGAQTEKTGVAQNDSSLIQTAVNEINAADRLFKQANAALAGS